MHCTGCLFWLVPPRKVLSMELVPPNREKMTEFNEDSNTPTKKVKVQVRAYHTLIFSAKLQQKVKVWHTLTWTFTFFVGIFAIFGELSHLSLLSGTSSILYWAGPVKKTPCSFSMSWVLLYSLSIIGAKADLPWSQPARWFSQDLLCFGLFLHLNLQAGKKLVVIFWFFDCIEWSQTPVENYISQSMTIQIEDHHK